MSCPEIGVESILESNSIAPVVPPQGNDRETCFSGKFSVFEFRTRQVSTAPTSDTVDVRCLVIDRRAMSLLDSVAIDRFRSAMER